MDTTATATTQNRPDTVVWIDERHALIARTEPEGRISTLDVQRRSRPENRFLAQVVHEIAGQGRVMVIGAQPMRLALERRYVAVCHRPDRLVAPSPAAGAVGDEIARGLDRLVA
jgi:hypothetical protein